MATRRVVTRKGKSVDGEILTICTVFEENICKEALKKMNCFSKTHDVLINRGHFYDWKEKRV